MNELIQKEANSKIDSMRQNSFKNFPFTDNFVLNIKFIYALWETFKNISKPKGILQAEENFVFFSNFLQSDHNGY